MTIARTGQWTRFSPVAWTVAIGLLTLFAAAARAGVTDGVWSEIAPPSRAAHSLIYDPVRDRLLLFGGSDGLLRDDVWSLPLAGPQQWTLLEPLGVPPSARQHHSAIYDPIADRMLVFGGNDGAPRADLWQLTLSGTPQWTQLSPGGGPPAARSGHSAIYDPPRHRMIVVAGQGEGGTVLADVWTLSLGGSPAWSAMAPLGSPPQARTRQVAIHDAPRDRLVMFGGDEGQLHQVLGDTWALSLGAAPAWTLIAPSGAGPEPRSRSSAIYDPNADRMLLQGGSALLSFGTYEDHWQLDLATDQWAQLGGVHPMAHAGGAIYDPVRARYVLVGGSYHAAVFFNSTLVRPLAPPGVWAHLMTPGPGSFITSHSAVFDPVRERMVTFGGLAEGAIDPAPIDYVWSFDLEQGAWEDIFAAGPSVRHGHAAVFDAARDRMLVFGGDEVYGVSPVRNDLWALEFSTGPAWTQLSPSGTPPGPRYEHTAVLDPVGERMLVFGGSAGGLFGPPVLYNDAWQLDLSPSPGWTLLAPAGTPPAPREGHAAVYDPVGQRVVVFGGLTDTGMLNDVWALTLSGSPTWTELMPVGYPPRARYGHVGVYDPVGHRMLVCGGYTSAGADDDVWALSLETPPTWSRFIPYGPSPGVPFQHAAVYDPVGRRMLLSGGYGVSGTWSFRSPGTVSAGSPPPSGLALMGARPNPAVGDLVVAFTLPDAEPARVELFDIAGRRVASRAVGALGAGPHRITLAPTGGLRAGIYLVRLTRASESLTARAAVVR